MATTPDTKGDLLYRERHKDSSFAEPVAFLKTPFNAAAPRFSPDGRLVSYVSDESGKNEVYVREFPTWGQQIADIRQWRNGAALGA